jgi:hypothetical protein
MSSAISAGSENNFGIKLAFGIGRRQASYSAFARDNRGQPGVYAAANFG